MSALSRKRAIFIGSSTMILLARINTLSTVLWEISVSYVRSSALIPTGFPMDALTWRTNLCHHLSRFSMPPKFKTRLLKRRMERISPSMTGRIMSESEISMVFMDRPLGRGISILVRTTSVATTWSKLWLWVWKDLLAWLNVYWLEQVHRESSTGDAVQLNVVQDTSHFQTQVTTSQPVGKIWGPWLWYLVSSPVHDDGSVFWQLK